MVRSNPNWLEATAWTQDQFGDFFWACDMCGVLYQALAKCPQCTGSAIDVEADQDVEQLINASTQTDELHATSMQQDWNAIPREGLRLKVLTNQK